MKKFLALVLALVMTMSLVTISAGAEFTDADSVTYEEAVDVMTALGVVTGDTTGAFNPTAGLTRGAAAKIICNMTLGTDVASALVASEAPYADVSVDNVFAGYIAFCANEGIVSGYADGTFQPAAPLTSYAFLKMLLGALGYDADVEGFVGTNWAINVAKVAKQRNLTAGNDDYVGSKAITREEAMLYAFNTLKSTTVEYTGSSNNTITIGDIVIKNNGDADYTYQGHSVTGSDFFYKDNFSKLSLDDVSAAATADKYGMMKFTANGNDAYGRDSYAWYLEKTTGTVNAYSKSAGDTMIGEYAKAASYVVVVDDNTKMNELKEICKDLGVDQNNVTDATYGIGTVVELYVDDEGDLQEVLPLVTKLGKITKVAEAKGDDADFAYTVTVKVGATLKAYKDTELVGFDADTMVKDAYVEILQGTDEATIELAEAVTGLKTAKGTEYVKVDGAKYFYSVAVDSWYGDDKTIENVALDFASTYDFYVDNNGYVIGVVLAKEADVEKNIFFVNATDLTNSVFDGKKLALSVVYLDGTEGVVEMAMNKDDEVKVNGVYVDFASATITDGFYEYTLASDGKIATVKTVGTSGVAGTNAGVKNTKELIVSTNYVDLDKDAAGVKVNNASVNFYATKDTVVTGLADKKATTVTGYEAFENVTYAVGTNNVAGILYVYDGTTLLNVYVVGSAVSAVEDVVVGVKVSVGDTYKVDATEYKDVVYNVKGVDTTYRMLASDSDIPFFAEIEVTDGTADMTDATLSGKAMYNKSDVVVGKVTASYVVVGGSPVYFADEVAYYDVSDVVEDGVVADDAVVKGDVISYTIDGEGEIDAVYTTYNAPGDGAIIKAAAAYLQSLGFNSTDAANAASNANTVVLQFTAAEDASYSLVVMTDEDGTVDETLMSHPMVKDATKAIMLDLTSAVSGFDKGEITYVIYTGATSSTCDTAVAAGSFIWE